MLHVPHSLHRAHCCTAVQAGKKPRVSGMSEDVLMKNLFDNLRTMGTAAKPGRRLAMFLDSCEVPLQPEVGASVQQH